MADVRLTLELRMDVRESTTHRVRKYGFGDGYEAVAVDGINSRTTEYDVTTEPIKSLATQLTFQRNLDDVAIGNFFLATLQPYSTTERRYRIKDNTYTRRIIPVSGAIEYSFTLVEAYAHG